MNTVFLDRIATDLVTRHAQELPDLRRITVLLPNYHVASPLAQALMRAAHVPALLLPQMTTLNDLAGSVPLESPVQSDSMRSALLYQELSQRKWFDEAGLWSMVQELLDLFDELTHALTTLPADAESFAAAVQQAYQARANNTLQLEARLVFELWHAMQRGDELDSARAYQQRLAQLAQQADQPLYVLRTSDWDGLEQRFLDAYAQRAAVTVFDLREMGERESPDYLRFFAATSLEQEACAAAMQVRRWLHAGKRDIAVIAQDRLAARRLRALLERIGVLVTDETGWTFATLSVSAVLDRWLTTLQNDFYHHDLLDLLKSPFIFSDMQPGERKAAVYQLEQLLRKHGVVSGLERFSALAAATTTLQQPLTRLHQAAALLAQGRKKTLADWLAALQESLAVLGIAGGLQQDDAGQQLLRALENWRHELAEDGGRYAFREWRRWLAQQFDTETYRDTGIESPVRFTHLAATRWRSFDAVLLLGCDAGHLPSVADGGRWFNDAVRASLDLPTRGQHAARQRDDLHALLALNDCVLVTWQREKNGEPGLLSPYLQMLRDELERVPGELDENELPAFLAAEDAHAFELPHAAQPAPAVAPEAVPAGVSVGAYNSLVACPYQFYARHILRLNELDEVPEEIEKRDYGELVHDILCRFHERYPAVNEHPAAQLEDALRQISTEVFADLLQQDFSARAWLERWFKSLPSYLEWQARNEEDGWYYAAAERAFEQELADVRLRGRIDRLDVKAREKRVLDYKLQGDQLLRNKLKEAGEDVQLACYAWAQEADEAMFVSIDNGKVKAIAPPHDIAQLAQLNAARLQRVIAELHGGARMPANGIDAVCKYCEMRGVCRKGEWMNL